MFNVFLHAVLYNWLDKLYYNTSVTDYRDLACQKEMV